MSRLYNNKHRALQDQFQSRGMADRVEDIALITEISEEAGAFIERLGMFFLSSVDHKGRPTVSYKGGEPGNFVRVIDTSTLAFPSYNGNGMFYSMGNIQGNAEVGLLFIDFEKPHRIRVQGRAIASIDDPLLATWPEAEMVVRVTVSELWQNCPRYIHRYQKQKDSHYVPKAGQETPVATWKRIDGVNDVLNEQERRQVEAAGGVISPEEWMAYIEAGDEKA